MLRLVMEFIWNFAGLFEFPVSKQGCVSIVCPSSFAIILMGKRELVA